MLAVTLLLGSAIARADAPDEAGPIPSPDLRWEVGAGIEAGFLELGTLTAHGAVGGRVRGGVERGRWALLGRADLYDVESSCARDCTPAADDSGHGYRFGVDARFAALQERVLHKARGGRGRLERLQLALELGVGRETIATGASPARSRPDLAFGFELALVNRAGNPYYGLRAEYELARAFEPDVAARATMPSPARGLDGAFIIGFDVALGD